MPMNELPYRLYLLFVFSFFLRFSERIPFLGFIRLDLVLIALIFTLLTLSKTQQDDRKIESDTSKILKILMLYIIISLPLTQWPGSVIRIGIPNFIKAVIFFYFTVSLITTEERLKTFINVFIICQSIRIIHPVFLHLTTGYWGTPELNPVTDMGDGMMMDRLAGGPKDILNPNGLAFVITSVIPFFHYTSLSSSFKYKILYISLLPIFVYALILTASRTGYICMGIIMINIFLRSRKKILMIIAIAIALIVIFVNLTELQRDRFLSIYRHDVPGSETAQGRLAGNIEDFNIAMLHPVIGHGLGTSMEAVYHATGNAQMSHLLYTEVLQELGFIGLIIFLFFMKSIISNFHRSFKKIKQNNQNNIYLLNLSTAMLVWLWMNIFNSFASMGLSRYEWYLFGGLSVVLIGLADVKNQNILLLAKDSKKNNSTSIYKNTLSCS
jgi:hypothetical protein